MPSSGRSSLKYRSSKICELNGVARARNFTSSRSRSILRSILAGATSYGASAKSRRSAPRRRSLDFFFFAHRAAHSTPGNCGHRGKTRQNANRADTFVCGGLRGQLENRRSSRRRTHPPARQSRRNLMGERMTEQAIYNIVGYAQRLEKQGIAPHDLRRTFAKLAHRGSSSINQIQLSLGHDSDNREIFRRRAGFNRRAVRPFGAENFRLEN